MKQNLLVKFQAVRQDLCSSILERETAVDMALLALLTGEHLLLLGPPGTAKSLLARSICERIQGSRYFERLLTKFSVPEEIFGPLSLSALEHDEYKRVTQGTLVEAHIGFIDEVFKANPSILNAMLGLMNERVFHEAGRAIPVPLLSLFGASNELPADDSLHALFDRFLLRVTVQGVVGDDSFRQLLSFTPTAPVATVTLTELQAAQQEVAQVHLTPDAIEALLVMKRELEMEGIIASDRRWKACAKLIKARAWLEGETQASSDHGEVLTHALWSEPGHIRAVERVVGKVANPLNLEAVELEDAAEDLYNQRPKPDHANLTEALGPILRQLVDIHARLETRIEKAPERRSFRARQAMAKIETWHRELSTLALRSLSKLHMAPGGA